MTPRGRSGLAAVGLAVLTLLCLAPFAGKAFGMDDPLYLWAAEHILRDPLDFYGLPVAWRAREAPLHEVLQNPPLACYFTAAAAALFGWGEAGLHAAFWLPAIALVLGVQRLARAHCRQPVWPALLALLSPVVLVSSTNVMCDTLFVALWTWSVIHWQEGLRGENPLRAGAGAGLAGLALLTKYFGLCLVPLLAAHALLVRRRPTRELSWLLVPLLAALAYDLYTARIYGHGLLSSAATYAREARKAGGEPFGARELTSLAFTGGCLLPVALGALLALRKSRMLACAALAVAGFGAWRLLAALGWASPFPHLPQVTSVELQFVLFVFGGLAILFLTLEELVARRDRERLTLALWVAGTFAFCAWVNWSVNGRTILPMVPAAAVLVCRRGEERQELATGTGRPRPAVLAVLGVSVLVGGSVLLADASFANSARAAAERVTAAHPTAEAPLWFEGHWGFQYYAQLRGAKPYSLDGPGPRAGELLVVPQNNTNNAHWPDDRSTLRERFELLLFPAAALMSPARGAGFYAHVRGALPFVLGPAPAEVYEVREVMAESPAERLLREGDAAFAAGRSAEAAATYERALALRPLDAGLLYDVGVRAARQGRNERAIQYYERAIAADPSLVFAHVNLGTLYLGAGRAEQAVAALRRAVELEPELAPAHYALGLGLQSQGAKDQARAAFREALELDPGLGAARAALRALDGGG